MNSVLHSLTAAWPWTTVDVLNHLWQSTAVGLVVLAVLALGRGLSARTRRALAWMALAKFALPTGFLVHAFAQSGSTPERWVPSVTLTSPMILPTFVTNAAVPVAEAPHQVSTGLVLALVWFAGFAGLFISWLVRGRSLRRQIFSEVQPIASGVELRIEAAARQTGLAESPRCWAVSHERAPGVLGVVAPVVILPRGLEATLAPAELDAVLIHEFVHVQRRDNLWSAVQAFLVSALWFHPLVWLLNRRLALEAEQSCDERVLEITGDPDTYAGGIVKAVQHALGLAQPGLISATTPPVITRIKNILAHGTRRDRPLVRGAALAGGVLVIALSGYAGSFVVPTLATITSAAAPEAAIAATPTATPPAPATSPAPAAEPAEPTLSVDFHDEAIRPIIETVARHFKLEVIFPRSGLRDLTTVKLQDAAWQQIFRVVLTPAGYTFVEEGRTVRIVPNHSESIASRDQLKTDAERLRREVAETQSKLDSLRGTNGEKSSLEARNLEREAAAKAAELAAVDARSQAMDKRMEQLTAKDEAKRAALLQQQQALAAEKPVAMASLPALATQSRLVAQAEDLKREAEALQREVEAANAAKSDDPEAKPDPEAAAKVAALAAIDARRQALDAAADVTGYSARAAELAAKHEAEMRELRAQAAEDRARQKAATAAAASIDARNTTSTQLPAPPTLQSRPKAAFGTSLDEALAAAAQPTTTRLDGQRVYEIRDLDQQPVPQYQARPQYPFEMRRAGIAGEVTVDFIVDPQGSVQNAYAFSSSQHEFEASAVQAVNKWKFKAGRKSGRNVPTHMQVPIRFLLDRQ